MEWFRANLLRDLAKLSPGEVRQGVDCFSLDQSVLASTSASSSSLPRKITANVLGGVGDGDRIAILVASPIDGGLGGVAKDQAGFGRPEIDHERRCQSLLCRCLTAS